jgi:hypothetical protein
MSRPNDLPNAYRFEHGTRARYVAGCRCQACTRANRIYARARLALSRDGDWNGLVSAKSARAHLQMLSASGIGRRKVEKLCGVSDTVLSAVKNGRKQMIRARSEKLILAVTPEANRVARQCGFCVPCKQGRNVIRSHKRSSPPHLCLATRKVGNEFWCDSCAENRKCNYHGNTGALPPDFVGRRGFYVVRKRRVAPTRTSQ